MPRDFVLKLDWIVRSILCNDARCRLHYMTMRWQVCEGGGKGCKDVNRIHMHCMSNDWICFLALAQKSHYALCVCARAKGKRSWALLLLRLWEPSFGGQHFDQYCGIFFSFSLFKLVVLFAIGTFSVFDRPQWSLDRSSRTQHTLNGGHTTLTTTVSRRNFEKQSVISLFLKRMRPSLLKLWIITWKRYYAAIAAASVHRQVFCLLAMLR